MIEQAALTLDRSLGAWRAHVNVNGGDGDRPAAEAVRESGLFTQPGPIAAPDVCDGTSAVGESRHRLTHQVAAEPADQPRQQVHVKKRDPICGERGRYYFTRNHHRFWKCRRYRS